MGMDKTNSPMSVHGAMEEGGDGLEAVFVSSERQQRVGEGARGPEHGYTTVD